jgi:pyrimidine oxygenase
MAGLAAVTSTIQLYASVAVLTMPPAVVARMAVTIDSISHGRFGINIVSGWQKAEYDQMGLWPGEAHFARRYAYCSEYVHIMRELWDTGRSDFRGEFFHMNDCRLAPAPSRRIPIVCAARSERGMRFAAEYGDYSFCAAIGQNTPTAFAASNQRLIAALGQTGRDVGTYVLMMIIADETDDAAMAKWARYTSGVDMEAVGWMRAQAGIDVGAPDASSARNMQRADSPVNMNQGVLIGSYARVAAMLDEAASVPGTRGIMLTFDDFVDGIENFGAKIMPLLMCRISQVTA